MKSNWWYNATPDERMQQVKNGAQLGLSVETIAQNLKVKPVVIRFFAKDHNIKIKEPSFAVEAMAVAATDMTAEVTHQLLEAEDSEFMLDIIQTFGDIFASTIEEWN